MPDPAIFPQHTSVLASCVTTGVLGFFLWAGKNCKDQPLSFSQPILDDLGAGHHAAQRRRSGGGRRGGGRQRGTHPRQRQGAPAIRGVRRQPHRRDGFLAREPADRVSAIGGFDPSNPSAAAATANRLSTVGSTAPASVPLSATAASSAAAPAPAASEADGPATAASSAAATASSAAATAPATAAARSRPGASAGCRGARGSMALGALTRRQRRQLKARRQLPQNSGQHGPAECAHNVTQVAFDSRNEGLKHV